MLTPQAAMSGSSPHVRGAVLEVVLDVEDAGIIPARAGSSCVPIASHPATWDHPRACGEQNVELMSAGQYTGSSPRVRGAG